MENPALPLRPLSTCRMYRMLPHEVTSRLQKTDVSSNVRETEKVEQKKTEKLVPTERQENTYENTTNESETIYLVKS